MKLTDALLAEHVVFHSIFASISKALPDLKLAAEVRTAAMVLLRTLEEHGKAEHDLLFPPIEPYLNDIGHLEHFHQEDDAITANLRSAAQSEDVESGKSHLHKAIRLAVEHFDKEERIVFPLAEKHISEDSLHSLGEQWRKLKDL